MKTKRSISVSSRLNPLRDKKSLALAVCLLVPGVTALAQTQWQGGTGANDYNNIANWVGGVIPNGTVNCTDDAGSNNIVLIQAGDPAFQHGDTLAGNAANTSGAWLQTGSTNFTGNASVGNWLRLALGTGSYGSYTMSNGLVQVAGQLHIGEYGVGYFEMDGGICTNAGDPFCIGDGDFGPSPVGYMVMNGGTVNTGSEMWIGEGNANNHGTGYLTMNGGTININFWWDIGRWGANGTLNMNGGTINKLGGGDCQWGAYNNGVASSATVNMTGGTINVNNNLQLGTGGNGTVGGTCLFNQSGGTVHVAGQYWVGNANIAGVCTNNLSSNAVLIVDNWLAVGRNGGVGTMNISGNASVTMTAANGGNITLSGDNGGTSLGTVNQNGGTVTNTASQTWIAENYNGFWNLNAGLDVLGVVHLTQNFGASGTFSLNGGDLFATEITDVGGGVGIFNFNGGTLHAGPGSVNLMHGINGAVYLQANAKINTESNNTTISVALNDNGAGFGVTKLGAGTLTLSGANNYSGPTIVSNGVLIADTANTALGSYTIEDNAGFGIQVSTPGASFTPSTLNLGNSTGTTLSFDLGAWGNPMSAPLNITGNLAVNGTNVVNIADAFPGLGQFHLLQYNTTSGSGKFVLGTLPVGVVATLVSSAGYLDLNITGVGLDVWDGLAGGNWDINLTTNWVNFATLVPTFYHDGDAVQFDDSVTGTTVVNLVATNAPSSLVFNNTLTNYTLVGKGQIIGSVKLVKEGTNTLAIYNTNGYTGPTVLDSGTIVVTNLVNGGLPSPIGASSANPTNLVLNGGTLSYQGASATINRGYSLQGDYGNNGGANVWTNVASIDAEGNVTISGPVTAVGTATFVKGGPGTLTYTATGTNQLSAGLDDPGYQVAGGTLVFDGSAGNQVNHSIQEFWVGDTTNSGANIILTNTTLEVDSWFSLSRGNGNYGWTCNGNLYNSTMTCGNFSLGWANGRPNLCSQNFTMTNSTLIDKGNFNISESAGSVGVANITGHSMLVSGPAGPMLMGLSSGATGSVLVANSSIVTNNGFLSCGANGYGTLTVQDNALYVENGDFNFGDYGAAGSTGILTITNNAQVVIGGGGVYVGKTAQAIGTVYQSGNTVVNASAAGTFQLGQQSGSVGTWYMNGNSVLVCGPGGPMLMGTTTGGSGSLVVANSSIVTNNAWLSCGANGAGTLTLQDNALYVEGSDFNFGDYGGAGTSGTLYISNNAQVFLSGSGSVYVGKTAQSVGTVYQSDNSVINARNAGVFQLGQQAGAVGTWYQSGGTNYAGGWVSIGRGYAAGDTSPTGLLVVSGGLFDQTSTGNGLIVGEQGTGTLQINNSGVVISEANNLGVAIGWNGGVGELDLGTGGTLVANFIQMGTAAGSTATFNFNGGLLKAGASTRLNFMSGLTTATILSGATIDTGANTLSIGQALLDGGMGGGLTKLGSGTLLLDGANTYQGATTVSAGTLGGSGTIAGSLVVSSGATLAPGDSTVGTLTLNSSSLSLSSGSATVMDLNKTTGLNSMVTGASTIAYGGTLVLQNLSGALAAGDTFTLFNAGAYSGSFSSLVSHTPNQIVSWDLSQLTVNGTVKVVTAVAATAPITAVYSGGNLNLSWPANQIGWELQQQTGLLTVGLTTNWVAVAGSTATNQVSLPVSSTVPCAFFRLVFPAQ